MCLLRGPEVVGVKSWTRTSRRRSTFRERPGVSAQADATGNHPRRQGLSPSTNDIRPSLAKTGLQEAFECDRICNVLYSAASGRYAKRKTASGSSWSCGASGSTWVFCCRCACTEIRGAAPCLEVLRKTFKPKSPRHGYGSVNQDRGRVHGKNSNRPPSSLHRLDVCNTSNC